MPVITTTQGMTVNAPKPWPEATAFTGSRTPAARSCLLVLACVVPLLSHAALPASRAYSSVETKVNISAGDFAGDYDTDNKPVPGTSSAGSTASRSYAITSGPLTGYSGSGSGSTSAIATAAYGTLKGAVSGSANAAGASAQGEARANATFVDYLSFNAPGGGPVSIYFGLGIEAAVSAVNGTAGAGIGGGISIWTPTTGKVLWSGGASISSATDPTLSAGKLVTFMVGDIVEIGASLGVNGGFGITSGHTGNPPVPTSKSGSFTADASNTAEVFFEILTPGATYESASGTVYRAAPSWTSPVPEAQTYALLLAGLAVVWRQAAARRRAQLSGG